MAKGGLPPEAVRPVLLVCLVFLVFLVFQFYIFFIIILSNENNHPALGLKPGQFVQFPQFQQFFCFL
jgi:hypothetical protein